MSANENWIGTGIEIILKNYLKFLKAYFIYFCLPMIVWCAIPLVAAGGVVLFNLDEFQKIYNTSETDKDVTKNFYNEASENFDLSSLKIKELDFADSKIYNFIVNLFFKLEFETAVLMSGCVVAFLLIFTGAYMYYDSKLFAHLTKFFETGKFEFDSKEKLKLAINHILRLFNWDVLFQMILHLIIPTILFFIFFPAAILWLFISFFLILKAYLTAYVLSSEYTLNPDQNLKFSDGSHLITITQYIILFFTLILTFILKYILEYFLEETFGSALTVNGVEILSYFCSFAVVPFSFLMIYYCYRLVTSRQLIKAKRVISESQSTDLKEHS